VLLKLASSNDVISSVEKVTIADTTTVVPVLVGLAVVGEEVGEVGELVGELVVGEDVGAAVVGEAVGEKVGALVVGEDVGT
jgi:hypothetical protein